MYHHFSDKEDLATTALKSSAKEIREDAEKIFKGSGTATEKLISYLERERDTLRGCPIGRMTYDTEVLATPSLLEPVSDSLNWLVKEITKIVESGVKHHELNPTVDARSLASMIVAVVQGGYVLSRANQDPTEFDSAIHGIKQLLLSNTHEAPNE